MNLVVVGVQTFASKKFCDFVNVGPIRENLCFQIFFKARPIKSLGLRAKRIKKYMRAGYIKIKMFRIFRDQMYRMGIKYVNDQMLRNSEVLASSIQVVDN